MQKYLLMAAALVPMLLIADAYEIGTDMESAGFWTGDPVLFVKRHVESGFAFTSDEREGADSRLDGGVSYYGLPVYESKLSFGEAGGVERVELLLFATAGTETLQEMVDESGRKFRRRVRLDKSVTKEEFGNILKIVRARLSGLGTKEPKPVKEGKGANLSEKQASQTWPKTDLPTQTTLTWNYSQNGKNALSFRAGFIRVSVDGPQRLASKRPTKGIAKKDAAKGAKKISDNVVRDPRGDVFIDNIPMVDQGQKGYCSVATAERVLRYYGVDVDEHEIAQAAGTSVEGGTSTLEMKKSVEAIGKKYRLGTVVCYGNFEKSVEERIAGLGDEVRAYNKAAKKLKKAAITDDMYIRHEGNTTYYSYAKVDAAMDAEVLKEMKVNGMQKSKFTRFMKDIHDQVSKGIPLFWGVTLGIYPESGLMQSKGGHMRLIIGYNDKKKDIIYSDSWGAGHEIKHMPAEWAWTVSHCLMYMKPLSK